jgi:hypothetical protein
MSLLALFFHAQLFPYRQNPQVYAGVQAVYDTYLGADAWVDYERLHQDAAARARLQDFIAFAQSLDLVRIADRNERLALFCNLYNVWTLEGVLRHWPVSSVKDIRPMMGFFTAPLWQLGGQPSSLNDLERLWIRPLGPGTHFLINCASRSCPRLLPTVFTPEEVQAAMAAAAKSFLADTRLNRFDAQSGSWQLSRIFEWYESDFGGRESMIQWVREQQPELASFPPKRLSYLEYDWSLNGRP